MRCSRSIPWVVGALFAAACDGSGAGMAGPSRDASADVTDPSKPDGDRELDEGSERDGALVCTPAGPPPAACVPPCLWALVRSCFENACLSLRDRRSGPFPESPSSFSVYSGNEPCLEVSAVGVPPSDTLQAVWTDGSGKRLALGLGDYASIGVVCGPFDGGASFGDILLNLPDGDVPESFAPGRPSCRAWARLFWP